MPTKIFDNTPNTYSTAQNVQDLSKIVSSNHDYILNLYELVAELRRDLTSLTTRVSAAETNINNLRSRVTALENRP